MRKLLWVLISLLFAVNAWAQAASPTPSISKTLKVGVYLEPPFVMKGNKSVRGYAIDLWSDIAAAQGWQSEYVVADTVPHLIAMTRDGRIDVAVTDLFITAQRIRELDFSHPYFDSGLQIMIDENRHPGLLDLVRGLASSGHLKVFAIGGVLILVATVTLTAIDRRFDSQFPRQWIAGMAESFYHVMQTTFTGKTNHKPLVQGTLGFVMAALWVGCGITIVAYITSSITSVMTANQIRNQINGPDDLPGKTVATIAGSTGEDYCRVQNLNTQVFNNIDEAVTALVNRQVSAIVYDAPILRYYDNSHPELPLTEVGPVFEQRKYGFGLPIGSPLRLPINENLLQLTENGLIARLNSKYFGDVPNVR